MQGEDITLKDVIWNKDRRFDLLWNDRDLKVVLENIYLDENRCKGCFAPDPQHVLGFWESYRIQVCDSCQPTANLELLKNKFFKE